MANAIVISRFGKLLGVFTQKQKAWQSIQECEEEEDLEKILVMVDSRPTAREEVVPLTYAKLCKQLSEMGRADIRSVTKLEPAQIRYGLWQVEINVPVAQ